MARLRNNDTPPSGPIRPPPQRENNPPRQNDESPENNPSDVDLRRAEIAFEEMIRNDRGFFIHRAGGDGNCMFRSIADQVYGDQEMHDQVRRLIMDYIEKEVDHFSQFVVEDIHTYIERKRHNHVWGDHLEIQAASEIFCRPIEVYSYSNQPINIFLPRGGEYDSMLPPIRLSYHGNAHYNSLVDPNNPAVGMGLGFANLNPRSIDREVVDEMIDQTERDYIESKIIETIQDDEDNFGEAIAQEEMAAAIEKSRQEYFASQLISILSSIANNPSSSSSSSSSSS